MFTNGFFYSEIWAVSRNVFTPIHSCIAIADG